MQNVGWLVRKIAFISFCFLILFFIKSVDAHGYAGVSQDAADGISLVANESSGSAFDELAKRHETSLRLFHLAFSILLVGVIILLYLHNAKIKRAKLALKISEEKFRRLAENSAEVIWASDLKLNLNYLSPSSETLLGFPRDERVKKTKDEIFTAESLSRMQVELEQKLSAYKKDKTQAQTIQTEIIGKHRDGHQVWIEVSAYFTHDQNGKINGLQGTARNITQRKQSELHIIDMVKNLNQQDKDLKSQNQELIESRMEIEKTAEQYYDLFDNGPVGYLILEQDGRVAELNSTASQLIGKSKDDIRWKSFPEFIAVSEKDHFLKLLYQSIHQNQIHQQEFTVGNITSKMVFAPDQIEGQVKCRLALVDVSGEVKTREKLSLALQSLQTVFDAFPGGIAVIDREYRIVNMNQKLMDIHGLSQNAAQIGKKCFEAFKCGDSPCSVCILDKVFRGQKANVRNSGPEDPIYNKGFYRIYTSPIKDNQGNVTGIVEAVMDLTRLKKAESALQESERNFEELFKDIPDAVFITGIGEESGIIIDVNPAAEKQTGYSRHELLGMNLLDEISENSGSSNLTRSREEKLLHNNKIELTERKRRKDGTYIWTEVVVQRILIDGQTKALSVSRNISDRIKIQDQLQESESRLRSLLGALPDILFIFDKDGLFVEYHSDTEEKLIIESRKFLNQKIVDVLPPDLAELTLDNIAKTLASGQMQLYDYFIDKPEGRSYFDVRMVKASENTVLTVVRDVTLAHLAEHNRKQNEEKFKTLFLNTPMGVFNFDQQSVILNCNTNFEKIIGSSSQVLVGLNMLTQLSNVDLTNAVRNALDTGSGYFEGNYKSVTSGKITPVKAFFKSIYDDNGDFVDGIGIVEDVTEQKKYEAKLIEALKRAEQSDKLKSSFMATMSHELRTPLNTVIGFADMIEEDMPLDQISEFTEIISKSGRHLLSIIEDILDISLIDSHEVKMMIGRFTMSELFENVEMYARQEKEAMGKDQVALEIKVPDEIRNMLLSGDLQKIDKVFSHLIKNALKFTKKGFIEIGVANIKPEADTLNVVFYVKDSGIGIPKNKQDIVFEIFRQADDSSTREFEGTGLGLSISKKLSQMMGGHIWLESEPNKGSCFYIELPLRASVAESIDIARKYNKPALSLSREFTVLVAEDDDTNYHLFELLLNRKKMKVLRAKNGKIAIKIVSENPIINLVLMDINMPVMNGYEAARKIKALRPELPVIAVTAYAMTSDRITAEKAGCDDYISKPINNTSFYELIAKYIA